MSGCASWNSRNPLLTSAMSGSQYLRKSISIRTDSSPSSGQKRTRCRAGCAAHAWLPYSTEVPVVHHIAEIAPGEVLRADIEVADAATAPAHRIVAIAFR